jgi:putative ABC transport system permease protein
MTLLSLIVRSFRARPGRAMMTLGSVIIGVAGVVSVGLAMTTTRGAYKQMYDALAGRAALEVVAAAGSRFAEKITYKLSHLPGVAAAVPSMQRPTVLYHAHHKAKVLALGIDPQLDRKVHDYDVAEGEFFSGGDGALLEVSFARSLDIKLQDDIRLLTPRGLKTIRVVGFLAPRGVAGFAQGAAVFLPLATAQRLFGTRGQVDSIQIVIKRGAKEKDVEGEIANALPAGLKVRPPAGRTQLAEDTLGRTEQALEVAGAVSLVLAAFIIINTFLMNISERRKQLATLRAIGATRRQIVRLLMGEGLVLGSVGTGLGILAGFGGAYLLTRAMERLLAAPLPAVVITWQPPLLGAVLGMIVSLASTYLPAYRASKISPLEGLRSISKFEVEPAPLWVTLLGIALLAAGGGLMAASVQNVVDPSNMVLAGVICLFGCVLLLPVSLRPAAAVLGAVLGLILPIEAQLAKRQVLRRRIRTALTAAVLFGAISAGIGIGLTILANVRDVKTWAKRTIIGDYFVRAMMPDMATGTSADVPETLRQEIQDVPGVNYVASVRLVRGEAAGQPVLIIAKEFLPGERLPLDLRTGDPDAIRKRLTKDEVVIGMMLAQKSDLTAGDEIEIDTPQGKRSLRIAGVANEYAAGGMTVFMERATAERVLGIEGVTAYIIKGEPSMLSSVEAALRTICDRDGLLLQSQAATHRFIDTMINGAVGGLWVLLALCFLVASFGIVNTLTMNVLEQTRELALLRAVAMTRRQMRRMIICQAAIIGLIGLVPGAAAGAIWAYLINTGTLPMIGHPINFDVNPPMLALTFLSALAMVLIAALLPAIRASRLNVINALKQE